MKCNIQFFLPPGSESPSAKTLKKPVQSMQEYFTGLPHLFSSNTPKAIKQGVPIYKTKESTPLLTYSEVLVKQRSLDRVEASRSSPASASEPITSKVVRPVNQTIPRPVKKQSTLFASHERNWVNMFDNPSLKSAKSTQNLHQVLRPIPEVEFDGFSQVR